VRCWIDERASNVEAVKTAVIAAVQQVLGEQSGEGARE
jgi:hypothetical protein